MKNYVYPASSVTIDTSALATAANQVIMIGELQDINTELDAQSTLLTTIETNQDAQTTLLTTIETNQDAQTTELQSINTELDSQTTLLTTIETNQDAQTTELQSINTELDAQTVLLTAIRDRVSQLTVVDFFDTPLLNAASTNIPGSATTPLTVVASLSTDIFAINVQDTTGFTVGLYSDPAGTPVLQAILNPGSDSIIPLKLPAGTALGLRNMESTSAISVGTYAINFLG